MAPPRCDIALVGAGAAGLYAAHHAGLTLREAGASGATVTAFDGARRLGAKILIAGGGRCNVTHDVVQPRDYTGGPGSTANTIKNILRSHPVDDVVAFFAQRGVELKREDTGKLFPTTDRARTVLNALLQACYDVDATLLTDHRVHAIERRTDGGGFVLTTSQGEVHAARVILCPGGRALPRTGSDGGGYRLAEALGHTVTPTWPALVPLRLPDGHWLTGLKGIAVDAELNLHNATGKVLHRQRGAVLLTHFGLSGPAAMDISRHFGGDFCDDHHRLSANLLPGSDFNACDAQVVGLTRAHPRSSLQQLVAEHVPDRLAAAVVREAAGQDPTLTLAQLTKAGRRALVRALTALPLPVVADRGYDHAEVTAGGVPLAEIERSTMESRVCPGLYLAGEILDVDGRIGGYNFQWAWCTGRLAGRAAALFIH